MWKHYFILETVHELLSILAENTTNTKIIAGGTDLMVEIRNGKWPKLENVLDISRIADLDQIWRSENGNIHIGALVTHNDVIKSALLRKFAYPLVQACWSVATPQLRNVGTIVGNVVTGSPANDTITPLMALNASLVLQSKSGERVVKLSDFYTGVRKTLLRADEFVREIVFMGMETNQKGNFKKSALRRAQAIAVLNCCVVIEQIDGKIQDARITLGSVAPTVVNAREAEISLIGQLLDEDTIERAADLSAESTSPISDVRASDDYRKYMVNVLVKNALSEIRMDTFSSSVPPNPPSLDSDEHFDLSSGMEWDGNTICTTINGEKFTIPDSYSETLLKMVRDRVGLTGTKAGCEEGECGACTLFLDGKAVVSCLIPAPRAHNARIQTIEGIQENGVLHPVQQAFIDHAAVQCGYCTPGFVMSAVKLLQENPRPDRETIQYGIAGNLCRCTGYYKIIDAIEAACSKS